MNIAECNLLLIGGPYRFSISSNLDRTVFQNFKSSQFRSSFAEMLETFALKNAIYNEICDLLAECNLLKLLISNRYDFLTKNYGLVQSGP